MESTSCMSFFPSQNSMLYICFLFNRNTLLSLSLPLHSSTSTLTVVLHLSQPTRHPCHVIQVRHGEFQFKVVRLEAVDILKNSEELLLDGELLYIATDEQDKDVFFKPMREKYTLKFLDDYFQEAKLEGVRVNILSLMSHLFIYFPPSFLPFTLFSHHTISYLSSHFISSLSHSVSLFHFLSLSYLYFI